MGQLSLVASRHSSALGDEIVVSVAYISSAPHPVLP